MAVSASVVPCCVLNSGCSMPMMGLGTWQTRSAENEDVVFKTVDDALKSGYRMFDTASVYKNEKDIGRSLKVLLLKYNLKRSDIFITSKLAPGDQGYDSAYSACLQSIDNLGCEYLDLYLIHWPAASKLKREDPKNLEYRSQSWKALEKLQNEGHAKSIGVSNYLIRHLEEMKTYSSVVPAVNQVEFHPYLYQKTLMEYCKTNNIILQAYSSLGIGKLVGDPLFVDMGKKYDKTSAHILYRWAIEHGAGAFGEFLHKFKKVILNRKLANVVEVFLQQVPSLHQLFINDKQSFPSPPTQDISKKTLRYLALL